MELFTPAGVAGCLACVNRVLSRVASEDTRTSTAIFITITIAIILLCCYNFRKVTQSYLHSVTGHRNIIHLM